MVPGRGLKVLGRCREGGGRCFEDGGILHGHVCSHREGGIHLEWVSRLLADDIQELEHNIEECTCPVLRWNLERAPHKRDLCHCLLCLHERPVRLSLPTEYLSRTEAPLMSMHVDAHMSDKKVSTHTLATKNTAHSEIGALHQQMRYT